MNSYYFREVLPTTFVEMNDRQIDEAIAQFKQAVKEYPDDFIIEGHDPIKENAYTSSSYIPGVYFPNTKIRVACSKCYDVCCLAMTKDGRYHIAMAMVGERPEAFTDREWERIKEACPQFEYLPLEEVLYANDEIKCMRELKEYINEANTKAEALANIKIARRKNGCWFQRLEANFPGVTITPSVNYFDGTVSSAKLSGWWYKQQFVEIYISFPEKLKEITPDALLCATAEARKKLLCNVLSYQRQLRVLHQNFVKCRKAMEKVEQAFKALPEAKDGNYHTHLGYALRDYTKNIINYW